LIARRLNKFLKNTAFLGVRKAGKKEGIMLYWASVFFIIALVAALFGFGGIASTAGGIAKMMFYLFVIMFVVSLVLGLGRRGQIR